MAGNANPAPLLAATVVEQIKQIAAAIRNAEVAPLIGARTSVGAGFVNLESSR